MIYQDKKSGKAFAKRFTVGGVTREKLYTLVASEGSKVVFFDVAPSEKAMPKKMQVFLSGRCKARIKEFEFDFRSVSLSNRSAKGLTVTKWPVRTAKKL